MKRSGGRRANKAKVHLPRVDILASNSKVKEQWITSRTHSKDSLFLYNRGVKTSVSLQGDL